MWKRTVVLAVVTAGLIGGCWIVQALAQQTAGEGDRPARDRPARGADRREEFRRRMADRMREQLGATEEEWKVLQPRIEKVQQLQRQSRGGFMRFGRRGGRRPGEGQRPQAAPEREQSEVEKKTEALRNLLEDKASTPQAIKAGLDALRAAREKAQQDLAAARKELRAIVTVRQEAQLVLMGLLD